MAQSKGVEWETCGTCRGVGTVIVFDRKGNPTGSATCPRCNGQGTVQKP